MIGIRVLAGVTSFGFFGAPGLTASRDNSELRFPGIYNCWDKLGFCEFFREYFAGISLYGFTSIIAD